MSESNKYNHLRDEKSLYLMQHNKNPVQWHPYGPEAIQKAKDENKPIFLSIGYSSCHWCHVMAEESFSDPSVANMLNEKFINIKVDREELPDIDQYYQLACQVMNGRGGWPLSAFLTPELKPYFVGTYFPKIAQEGIPSFTEVITNLAKAFHEEHETVTTNANQIVEALKQPPKVEHKVEFEGHYPNAASVLNALKQYQDSDHGGYGSEPKFPHFSFLEWAVEHTLEGMVPEEFVHHIIKSAESILFGGIYDHARGGVHRYAVDAAWQVPHFEKMLYDQAGFLKLFSKLSLIYPSPAVFDSLIQTLEYLKLEMLAEDGFFFSAQDADSEGEEGLYFTFTQDEFIDALVAQGEELVEKQADLLKWFNITQEGNFKNGLNVITLDEKYKEEFYKPEGWTLVRETRRALLKARKERIPPATDSKGIASWNFQLAAALLDCIQYTKIEAIQNAANDLLTNCLNQIHSTFLFQDENSRSRIKTTTTRGEHVPLFEDYVFFSEFCFRLYELTGQENFLTNGIDTLQFIYKEFYKDECFFTRAYSYSDTEEYENIHTPIFDSSYKSALGTYLGLLRKWSSVENDFREYLIEMDPFIQTLTHLSLQNPLAFGETLRALVYPDEAYRKIEVPLGWLKNRSLHPFLVNFSVRFALKYHQEDNDNWQICTLKECELKGSSLAEFKNVFTPQQEG